MADPVKLLLDLYGEQPEEENMSPWETPLQQSMMPQQEATPPVTTGTLSTRIQEWLGAKEADDGGIVKNILSSRFNDNSSGASFGDYSQGIIKSALGQPTLGSEIAQSGMQDTLKKLASLAEIQKLAKGNEFDQLINTYQSMPDTDPRKQFYKDKIGKETTISSLFGPIAGVDPKTGMPTFGTRGGAASGDLLPPAPAGYKYAPGGALMRSEPSTRDQMRLQKSVDAAGAASGVERLTTEANQILGRYTTDKAAPILGGFQQALNVVGLADKQKVQDFERLNAISKDLGAMALAQFGGNDTDKELQIAIQTNLNPSGTVGSNIQTVGRKLLASQILQNRPIFEEEWLNRTGSLTAPDPQTGETFSRAWMSYQKRAWNEGLQQIGADSSQGGIGPQGGPVNLYSPNQPTSGGWSIEQVD